MLMDDPKLWRKRIEALEVAINETIAIAKERGAARERAMEKRYGSYASNLLELLKLPEDQRPDDLREVTKHEVYRSVQEMMQIGTSVEALETLRSFSCEAFEFFHEGYYGNGKKLPVSNNFPPRYVMRTILNQVSFDLNIFQHAINQRQNYDGQMTQQGKSLFVADRLASMSVQPAIDAGFLETSTTIVSYLDKRLRARLVPYYDVILISIAFASMQQGSFPSRDFLAIPHEIGHHLYWNGVMPDTQEYLRDTLREKLRAVGVTSQDWRYRWLEEMFADVYALIIGGPVVALDFQDMLDDDVPTHFREDTDKHPIPELRPMIHTRILRNIKPESGCFYLDAPDRLDNNWKQWIRDQWPGRDILNEMFQIKGKRAKLSGQHIIASMDVMIATILDILKPIIPQDRNTPWSADVMDEEDINFYDCRYDDEEVRSIIENIHPDNHLAHLYLQFYKNAYPQDDDEIMSLVFADKEYDEETQDRLIKKFMLRKNSFHERIEKIAGQSANDLSTGDWVEMFLFQGWSDEGPLGGGGGGKGTDSTDPTG